jgi:hypothetical protein
MSANSQWLIGPHPHLKLSRLALVTHWKTLGSVFWGALPERIRLSREVDKIDARYDPLIEKAETTGNRNEYDRLLFDSSCERDPIIGRLMELETSYWLRRARRFHVPVPQSKGEPDENWEKFEDREYEAYWHLSDAAVSRIRNLIRKEQKYRRQVRLAYVSAPCQILAAITGVLGTLFGVLTALHWLRK